MGFGNPFSKIEGAIRQGLDRLGNDIRNGIGRLGGEIEGKLRGLGSQIESGFRRVGSEIEGKLKGVGNEIESGVKKVGHDIESEFKQLGHKIEGEIATAGDTAKKGLQDFGDTLTDSFEELETTFTDKVPELFELALKEVVAEIQKGVLNQVVDAIQVVVPKKLALTLGPLSFDVDNLNDRIDTIQEWASNPPKETSEIKKLIETFAPTDVTLDLSAGLALVFVQSDSLSVGASFTYDTEEFLDKLDELFGVFS